jgi:hypothetical protein
MQPIVWLVVLALAVASAAWTITHEELFREAREFCATRSRVSRTIARRKFFYVFTCEYCFSHYVSLFFIALTRYRLLLDDWRGYVIAFFALTAVANLYLSLYAKLRVDIKVERLGAEAKSQEVESRKSQSDQRPQGVAAIPDASPIAQLAGRAAEGTST